MRLIKAQNIRFPLILNKIFLLLHKARFILLLFGFVFYHLPLNAGNKVELRSVKYLIEDGFSRVIVELSGSVQITDGWLKNPERLYIDLKGAVVAKDIPKKLNLSKGILKSLRIGQFSPDVSRLVFEFSGNKIERYEVSRPSAETIIIDVFKPIIKTIVLDAGHGGYDPGAIGKRGLREKDITLDIALRIKKSLEKSPQYRVFLTRDKDIFLELRERTEIANRRSADLFISIHANANPQRRVRGIETYLLNWTDDETAMRVAARENAISMKKMRQARTELDLILTSLELQSKRDESLRLAHTLQNSIISLLNGRYTDVPDLGVKQALFYVLIGAKMPSALIEVSFISNPKEEKLLRKSAYRRLLAQAIADGIGDYLTSLPVQKLATKK